MTQTESTRKSASTEQESLISMPVWWIPMKCVIAVLGGVCAYLLYTQVMWGYLMTMTDGALEDKPGMFLASLAIWLISITFLCFVNLELFARGIPKWFLALQKWGYCILVFFAIMLKSPGVRRINWNVTAIANEMFPLSPTLMLNLLLFVPIGMMLYRPLSMHVWARVTAVAVIASMEFLQYILRLGVCDVNDVIINCGGIACGMLLAFFIGKCGYVVNENQGRYRVLHMEH